MPTVEPILQLHPTCPPGRVDRKAALYASEIVRLRHDGYTYEAIREALLDVGIRLTTSTLRREFHRPPARSSFTAPRAGPIPNGQRAAAPLPAPQPSIAASANGREMAESFFNAHPSNPLLRLQEAP